MTHRTQHVLYLTRIIISNIIIIVLVVVVVVIIIIIIVVIIIIIRRDAFLIKRGYENKRISREERDESGIFSRLKRKDEGSSKYIYIMTDENFEGIQNLGEKGIVELFRTKVTKNHQVSRLSS